MSMIAALVAALIISSSFVSGSMDSEADDEVVLLQVQTRATSARRSQHLAGNQDAPPVHPEGRLGVAKLHGPTPGDWVYVQRMNGEGEKWREGPGFVVAPTGPATWISMKGGLLKVRTENLELATEEEKKAIKEQGLTGDLAHGVGDGLNRTAKGEIMVRMQEDLGARSSQHEYVDLTSDPPQDSLKAPRKYGTTHQDEVVSATRHLHTYSGPVKLQALHSVLEPSEQY
eukprot:gnl/TRDRNA2_/TRDRNA2_188970_c0_seq1.p1 gnl/TRDRNA2_/TRDRNA2_188970_c0~~gnl/TRDRNA2_/TRDRNA2_188970_c0_seq1.p1  ORF type:complete len:229 (-),score=46.59 gnl/TRDRNA2_/TRDRNA2_188970_c0_seq1:76-762(-)